MKAGRWGPCELPWIHGQVDGTFPLQGCPARPRNAQALIPGCGGAAVPAGVPGWGGERRVELGLPLQVEGTCRLWGAERCLRPQLWLRVTSAPSGTAAYGWCTWARATRRNPGRRWRNIGAPRAGKTWASTEKVVAAQTFLTLSSSLRSAE